MDPLRYLAENDGFFTRAQARDCGYRDKDVAGLIRGGVWHRFKRGYYTYRDVWDRLDQLGRYRVRCAAALRSMGPHVALSHTSALAQYPIDLWGLPFDRVHVTRLDGGAGRFEAGTVHHEGLVVDEDLRSVDGLVATAPDRAAVEAAIDVDNEVSLATFDSVLRAGLATPAELMARFAIMQSWPKIRHLHIPIRMADGRSGSPGESRGRWLFWSHHLPAPELQYEVRGAGDELLGITDWAWPEHQLLGEFDGRVKYGRLLRPGQDPGDVVFAEKRREDALREATGFRMIRLTWSDLERERLTDQRLRSMMRLAS